MRLPGGRNGRGVRLVVATALVCAVTGLAAPGVAQAAEARPEPRDSAGSAQHGGPSGRPGPEARAGRSLEDVRRQIDRLYHEAEAATDAYNAARSATERQSREIVRIAKAVVAAQERMDRLKRQAGALARAQYRIGGLPDEAQLLLGRGGPEEFLRDANLARKGQQATKGLMTGLARTQKELDAYAKSASGQWRRLEENRERKAAARKRVEGRLKDARKLESELEREELERLRRMEAEEAREAQAKWLGSGVLEDIRGEASKRGGKAVAFATAQIGKDYVWGAEGPDTYDCSGLTSQAWRAAGRPIPRTSQEQWKQLPRIDIEDMRPGDLIIYHGDASHVGMYVGDGAIVHAPRPGRQVTLAGAGSMRILGVVRPDK
ncbi:NlpC/P60 family protein [Streptomyces pathocidini]|uniref:NlpC/P60 family protein n=1 Tax=Streptomyces pathocidini TaxID=1650571 RepID=A0ABW7UTH8_9ACTN|nr:C40 family peptidase [Streptomyces pathocidini]